MRDFVTAARTVIEGDSEGTIAAVGRILNSAFSDPKGFFYLTRHLAHLHQVDAPLELFERVVWGRDLLLSRPCPAIRGSIRFGRDRSS